MELTIKKKKKNHDVVETIVNSFPSVSVFWKSIASFIRETAIPGVIKATSKENGSATIFVKRRNTGVDGIYTEVADKTYGLSDSPFSERYLIKGEKAYVLSPIKENENIEFFTATYGKSDDILSGKGKRVRAPYPVYLFWVKYYEKLVKGYKDRSRFVHLSAKTIADNEIGTELFQSLLDDTKRALPVRSLAQKNRNTDKLALSETQIEKTWRILNHQLKRAKTVKTFQRTYRSLLSLLPKTTLPEAETITANTIENGGLIKTITAVLSDLENIVASKSSLADCGITITRATDADDARIRAMLPSDIAERVETVYAVHNPKKEINFKAYCARRNITTTKELWHGSRNENWLSIIKNGLRLNPNATITGKMYGDGIYFAPEARKSYGYTSCQGTYWANGSSHAGFMGLFTTAYGNPCHETDSMYYRYGRNNPQKYLTRKGFDCLHALSSKTSLRHDEIVFYHESAIVLSYLVKIKS